LIVYFITNMEDLRLKNAKSCPALSAGPCLAMKTSTGQILHGQSKSFWKKTKRPKISDPLWSATSFPRVEIKNQKEIECTKSPKLAVGKGRTSRIPLPHLAPNDSRRMGSALHEEYESNPACKSYNSLSSDGDHYANEEENDVEEKKCEGFNGGSSKAPGINTTYITDNEALLEGSRCSNPIKVAEISSSTISDSESLDVWRLRELGDGKDNYAGLASPPSEPSLEYQKGQSTCSQCSVTYNVSTGTSVLSKTAVATIKYSPDDKKSLFMSSSLTSDPTVGRANIKNAQAMGQSRIEYLYHRVKTPKLQSVLLPSGKLSKIKTLKAPKPGRQKLKYCTLEDIIRRINHPFCSDYRTKRMLLVCYRAFCSRRHLLAALEKFYDDPILPEDCQVWDDSIGQAKRLMRIKLLNLISYWLREFFHDFDNDDLQRIQEWTCRILAIGDNTTSKCVKSIVREISLIRCGKTPRVTSKIFQCDYPDPLFKEDDILETIFDVPSEEIARQMCLMDHDIFSSIRPHEFLGTMWKQTNCHGEAPNIRRLINHFNLVNCWSQVMILSKRSIRERADILGRLLDICFHLNRLENLNSFSAIMSGIRCRPIYRLKKTFSSLRPKHAKMFRTFQKMLKFDRNQKNLRNRMATLVEPGIPHIGLLLQDLLSIDNGNDNAKEEKLNFSKYTLLSDRIDWCLQFQGYPYHFRPVEKVQEELRRYYHVLPNDFLYELSLLIEPREYGNNAKILQLSI